MDSHGSLTLTPPFSLLVVPQPLERTMKTPNRMFQDKHHNHGNGKRERYWLNIEKGVPFVLTTLLIASIFSLFFLYAPPNPLTLVPNQGHDDITEEDHSQMQEQQQQHAMISKLPPSKPHKGMFQNDQNSTFIYIIYIYICLFDFSVLNLTQFVYFFFIRGGNM